MQPFHASCDREDGLFDTLTVSVKGGVVYWQGNAYEDARAMPFCCVPIVRSFLLHEDATRDLLRISVNRYTLEFMLTADGGCDYSALAQDYGISIGPVKLNEDAVRGLAEYLADALLTGDSVPPEESMVPDLLIESWHPYQVMEVHNESQITGGPFNYTNSFTGDPHRPPR